MSPPPNARHDAQLAKTCLFLLVAHLTSATSSCWSIDGFQDSNALVCDPSAEVSSCCSASDICYSNGLCGGVQSAHSDTLHTPFFISGCTEQSFQDAACSVAPKCRRDNSELPSFHTFSIIHIHFNTDPASKDTGFGVVNCGGGHFCCYGIGGCGGGCPYQGTCDCSGFSEVFSLPPGSILTSLPASTRSGTTTSTSFPVVSSATSSDQIATGTTSPSAPSNDTNPINSSGDAEQSQQSDSTGKYVGAGVGVGIGLVAAGLLFWWWWWRRGRSGREEKLAHGNAGIGTEHGDCLVPLSYHERTPEVILQHEECSDSRKYADHVFELSEQRDPVQLDSTSRQGHAFELPGRQF